MKVSREVLEKTLETLGDISSKVDDIYYYSPILSVDCIGNILGLSIQRTLWGTVQFLEYSVTNYPEVMEPDPYGKFGSRLNANRPIDIEEQMFGAYLDAAKKTQYTAFYDDYCESVRQYWNEMQSEVLRIPEDLMMLSMVKEIFMSCIDKIQSGDNVIDLTEESRIYLFFQRMVGEEPDSYLLMKKDLEAECAIQEFIANESPRRIGRGVYSLAAEAAMAGQWMDMR